MKSLPLGVARLLGSVAMRHRHPCALGDRLARLTTGNRGFQWLIGPSKSRDKGVAVPRDDRLMRLEAVFFLSQHPQSSRKLAKLTGLADGTKARTLVRTLNQRYDATGSAFRIEEVAGGFQLMTRPKFAPWLRRLHSAPAEVRLSAPAMETLAVVAYRQPVLRADIEAIRGVQSGEVLRQLIERDLVRIVGRSDELGRPFLYGTTKQFLQTFGLRHIEELPRANVLQNPPNHSTVAEEETNVKTLITTEPRLGTFAEDQCSTVMCPCHDDRLGNRAVFDKDDKFDDEQDFEEDFDDDEEDEDEEEGDDEEDLDDEPWEEVEEEDEEEEDEDWDDDDDWEDEDEDWEDEDEDDDWDDDDDEEEEEEEEEE